MELPHNIGKYLFVILISFISGSGDVFNFTNKLDVSCAAYQLGPGFGSMDEAFFKFGPNLH